MSRQSEVANRMLNTLVLRTQSQKILEPITGKWKVRVVEYDIEKTRSCWSTWAEPNGWRRTEAMWVRRSSGSRRSTPRHGRVSQRTRTSPASGMTPTWPNAARTWAEAEQLDGEGIRTLNACLQLMVASQHGCPGFPAQVWQSHVVVPPRNAVSR